MVRIGGHSLELVHATTKATLPEYTTCDGETWVEGRPGDEYLLKLTSHQSDSETLANPILVDGTSVGWAIQHSPIHANRPATLGPITTAGVSRNMAGRIDCPAFRFSRLSSSDQSETTRHGTVSVTWSDARDTGQPGQFQSNWNEAQTSAADSKKDGVGALKSTLGSSSSVEVPVATSAWVPTNRLYTITIRYCEQAGLVARKIIPAPQAAAAGSTTSSDNGNHQRHGPARKKKKSNDGSARRAAGSVVGAEVVDLTTATSEEPVSEVKQESRLLA